MKTVQCPYCSVNFETIGFRPINFKCVQCGADAEWYAGFAGGEPRGLISWNANGSTHSWLYNRYMNAIMQNIHQLEHEIHMYLYHVTSNANDVNSDIMVAIASLNEQLTVLYAEFNSLILNNPAEAAEVMQEIKNVERKIENNQLLVVQLHQISVKIENISRQFMEGLENLKDMAENSFYQIIDAITDSNQEDLSSDGAIYDYSSEDKWERFTRKITRGVNDIRIQVQLFYHKMNSQIQKIKSHIRR